MSMRMMIMQKTIIMRSLEMLVQPVFHRSSFFSIDNIDHKKICDLLHYDRFIALNFSLAYPQQVLKCE